MRQRDRESGERERDRERREGKRRERERGESESERCFIGETTQGAREKETESLSEGVTALRRRGPASFRKSIGIELAFTAPCFDRDHGRLRRLAFGLGHNTSVNCMVRVRIQHLAVPRRFGVLVGRYADLAELQMGVYENRGHPYIPQNRIPLKGPPKKGTPFSETPQIATTVQASAIATSGASGCIGAR